MRLFKVGFNRVFDCFDVLSLFGGFSWKHTVHSVSIVLIFNDYARFTVAGPPLTRALLLYDRWPTVVRKKKNWRRLCAKKTRPFCGVKHVYYATTICRPKDHIHFTIYRSRM